MRKPCIALMWITLILSSEFITSAPVQKSLQTKLNPMYLKAMAAYRKLEPKIPHEELRALTTIGILNGAKQAEQQMERHLIEVVSDLLQNTNIEDDANLVPKIEKIEEQLKRDQKALEILTKSMDLAMHVKDTSSFKKDMQNILADMKSSASAPLTAEDGNANVGKRVAALRRHIVQQMDMMKHVVDGKIDDTLDYLIEHANAESLLAKASSKVIRKRYAEKEEAAHVREINGNEVEDDIESNLVLLPSEDKATENTAKRETSKEEADEDEDEDDDNLDLAANNVIETNSKVAAVEVVKLNASQTAGGNATLAKQEEASPELLDSDGEIGGGGGGGGLVGIITSLSGGEGGSDIGALIGALTGVISQLFGPNGLDVETLISSASALIVGLLSGDKNFGIVLGTYVGLLFDGLSGGGGAINNGQFLGNFLGTVVAQLSAVLIAF